MDCEHDRNFKRLTNILKMFFLPAVVIGIIAYQQYRYSIETIEVEILSKNVTWFETCDESQCYEVPRFNVITPSERFITTKDIYEQIEPQMTYFLGVKGWAIYKLKRKVVKLY